MESAFLTWKRFFSVLFLFKSSTYYATSELWYTKFQVEILNTGGAGEMINLNFWEMDFNFCLRRYIQARNRIALRYHNRQIRQHTVQIWKCRWQKIDKGKLMRYKRHLIRMKIHNISNKNSKSLDAHENT